MNELVSLVEKVENPGTFSVSGTFPSIPPGLKVKGFGTVSLPLVESQAKALIKLADQAPFGRGEETIVDTNVRNVWQISPENFEISNPKWDDSIHESITEMVGKPLGLYGCKIECKVYKLLIYEKGSFFKVHRDTEKIPNMFATLVINLPSEHEGGEMIVSHGGHAQSYSFAKNDLFHPDFVAFYSDCYHEVKAITSGYRICLIYNLAIVNRKKQPILSDQFKNIENISEFIQEWTKKKQTNSILCYLLEHSYTEKNLSFSGLKNGDLSKATVLINAAEKNNCNVFLCLVKYCRESYGSVIYYGGYSYDDDDLDEADFEEVDVEREEIYAHCLIASDNKRINVKKLNLGEDEIIAKIPLLEGSGRNVSISEATGNEGATKELWYQRGAVIFWPRDRDFDMITKMDINYGIHYLKQSLQELNLSKKENRKKIIELADYIIDSKPSYELEDISQELIKIGEIKLLKKFIHKQMNKYYDINCINSQMFLQIVDNFGWQHFEEDINSCLANKKGVLEWINSLIQVKETLSSESKTVLEGWFEIYWKPSLTRGLTIGTLSIAIQVVSILKIHKLVDPIIEFLSIHREPSFLTNIYGSALVKTTTILKGYDYERNILKRFTEDLLQKIQINFPSPPVQPKDYFREGLLKCKCEYCSQINQFLPDPVQREISFYKTLKRDLIHIELEINKSKVELDINIIRTPPKFMGTLKKNHNKYDNKLDLYNQAQEIVKVLNSN